MEFKEEELDYNLAKEFNTQMFIHKSSIVIGALMKFYTDLASTGVTFPEFMQESPKKKALKHYYDLLADRNMFNIMYNRCWEKYAEVLP